MIYYHDIEQGSREWLALRDGLWTGTKAIRLLQGKIMLPDYDFDGNRYTKRGQLLERIAIQEYERLVGHKVFRPGFVTNSAFPNAGYSPDGIDDAALLEVKALNGNNHERLAAGDIPLEFLVQIYFGMVITGLRQAKLLAFNPEYKQQLTILDVEYDKTIANNIRKKLRLDLKTG